VQSYQWTAKGGPQTMLSSKGFCSFRFKFRPVKQQI